jgi:hypothetical protein
VVVSHHQQPVWKGGAKKKENLGGVHFTPFDLTKNGSLPEISHPQGFQSQLGDYNSDWLPRVRRRTRRSADSPF